VSGSELILVLAALLGGGGIATGVALLFKMGPEREKIIVDAAHGAVIVQSGVIDDLQEQLQDARERISDLTRELHETARGLKDELDVVRRERDELREENRKLRLRVDELEREVRDLLQKGLQK